ncbi:MAG TPA: glycine cleavage system protein GcvH [Brevefilum sp.]|nr:glycine cleavage system protein GcvH [Brevefilum sp.]
MKTPQELKYAKTDEWIKVDGDKAIIGISDYAQDQLSDIVYVEFVIEEGDSITKDSEIATVESVKAAAEVNAPASGTVIAVNEELSDEPERLNNDPYGAAWLIKIKLDDPSELDSLMSADEYDAYNEDRED